jgi:hypothetical protein
MCLLLGLVISWLPALAQEMDVDRREKEIENDPEIKQLEAREKIDEESIRRGEPTRAQRSQREDQRPTRRDFSDSDYPVTSFVFRPLDPAVKRIVSNEVITRKLQAIFSGDRTFSPPFIEPSRSIEITNSYDQWKFRTLELNDPLQRGLVFKDDLMVFSGEVWPEDETWARGQGLRYVVRSHVSPKQHWAEYAAAAALVSLPFQPYKTVLLDALPYEEKPDKSRAELKRMGLAPKPVAWQMARQEIASATQLIKRVRATKATLEGELKVGDSNILFLIAHSDSKSLFLPGLNGERLDISELNSIRRDAAPNRVIVLFACSAGEVSTSTESIADVLIRNRLATSVMASGGLVYADQLAAKLRRLNNGEALRNVLSDLTTIVQTNRKRTEGEATMRPPEGFDNRHELRTSNAPPDRLAMIGSTQQPDGDRHYKTKLF